MNVRVSRLLGVSLACWSALALAVPAAAQLSLVTHVSGLNQPVGFVQDPSNPTIQYVVEQGGSIRVVQNGVLLPTPFLTVSASEISTGGERGLLGLAFAPDYGTSRRFFINFTNTQGHTVVARFLRSAINPLVADPGSRFDLRWGGPTGQRFIAQPFANHNGGHMSFGPDGYLYIALGDGGSSNDPEHLAQDPTSLLGKILRIDVNVVNEHTEGYVVPADNPFVDSVPIAARPEIWAFGLRNPWRFSFDDPAFGGTGAMFIGDVGQAAWEEVDYQPPGVGGRNYGWRNREGAHPNPNPLNGGNRAAAYLPLIDPIIEYDHSQGSSITGGFVYRGQRLSVVYRGRYFFADFGGRVWSAALLPAGGNEVISAGLIEHTGEFGGASRIGLVSSFGTDAAGELYIVGWSNGTIMKIVDPTAPPIPPPAADFNGDARPDLVWFHEGTRELAVWNMGGGLFGEGLLGGGLFNSPALPPGWRVVGTADADADGQTDLFLQSDTGGLGVWTYAGINFRYGISLNPGTVSDPAWRIKAVADFNHDGSPDLVWQHGPTGRLAFWLLNGITVIGYVVPSVAAPGPDWLIVGTGDANHDGQRDIYWQHRPTGMLAVWRMNETEVIGGLSLSASPTDPGWHVVGTADLDRDGSTDLVLQHATTLDVAAWYLNGEAVRFGRLLSPSKAGDPGWRVVGPR